MEAISVCVCVRGGGGGLNYNSIEALYAPYQ